MSKIVCGTSDLEYTSLQYRQPEVDMSVLIYAGFIPYMSPSNTSPLEPSCYSNYLCIDQIVLFNCTLAVQLFGISSLRGRDALLRDRCVVDRNAWLKKNAL